MGFSSRIDEKPEHERAFYTIRYYVNENREIEGDFFK